MAQWKIGGRQAACSVCAEPFKDGERHHSMVRIRGDRVDRFDGCQACWDAKRFGPECPDPTPLEAESTGEAQADPQAGAEGESSAQAEPGEAHRFWWTTRHQVAAQKTVAMDMDALQRLFLELQGREERPLRELRYVLCLLLMRKKRVKLERILREEAGESFIVRRPKTEERYTVEVFDFTPERMAEIREHLQAIFDGVDSDESLAAAARGEELDEPAEQDAHESEDVGAQSASAADSQPATEAPQS